jgi:glycosyltransferase involved in cell wall biosynthesis
VRLMPNSLLNELVAPGSGKSGWPWTKDSGPSSPQMPAGSPWPKVSIVTPSFNQGQFLEETIRSVLLQNYPNLEYIVIDGGSTDNSLEVIKKYEKHLAYWQSRKDGGQADAIAQGFDRATGDILSWLNSDDILLPTALKDVAGAFAENPKTGVVYGDTIVIDKDSSEVDRYFWPAVLFKYHWALGQPLGQESCFWRSAVYRRVGGINKNKFFIMDYDLLFRMWKISKFKKIRRFIGGYRIHEAAKNTKYRDVWLKELKDAKEIYGIKELGYFGLRFANRIDRFQNKLERLLFHYKDPERRC